MPSQFSKKVNFRTGSHLLAYGTGNHVQSSPELPPSVESNPLTGYFSGLKTRSPAWKSQIFSLTGRFPLAPSQLQIIFPKAAPDNLSKAAPSQLQITFPKAAPDNLPQGSIVFTLSFSRWYSPLSLLTPHALWTLFCLQAFETAPTVRRLQVRYWVFIRIHISQFS